MQGELLKLEAGIDMIHVPYKGDVPAMQDVLGGQVTMMFVPVAPALPHIQSGKLRALAVTSAKRLKSLPNVPTMAEAQVPNFVVEQWQAVYVPKGTPKSVVDRLNQEDRESAQGPGSRGPPGEDRSERRRQHACTSLPSFSGRIQRSGRA